MTENEKRRVKWIVVPIVIVILIAGLIYMIVDTIDKAKKERVEEGYNNGVCIDCGGTLRYSTSVVVYGELYHIYICDKCSRIYKIETDDKTKFYAHRVPQLTPTPAEVNVGISD